MSWPKNKEFLAQMDRIIPWGEWKALIQPYYYKGERGNKPYELELITAVDAHSCAGIGEGAFRGCTGLQQILLPKDCTIAPNAFTLCGTILVYAPAGGTTEAACDMIVNCVFVEYGLN